MILLRPHVRVAQVRVCVDLQDGEARVLPRRRRDERRGNGMFSPEREQEFVAADDLVGDALDFVEQRLDLAERQFHLRQREDADTVHVDAEFFVPQLHVRRGLQDLVRSHARASDVRRGAIDGDWKHDNGGIVESGRVRKRAAEAERHDVIVTERILHY